jgi:hypothetical protein
MENRQERRVGEETRVATASPEAGTLAGGTARWPHRDGRSRRGVPYFYELTTRPTTVSRGSVRHRVMTTLPEPTPLGLTAVEARKPLAVCVHPPRRVSPTPPTSLERAVWQRLKTITDA